MALPGPVWGKSGKYNLNPVYAYVDSSLSSLHKTTGRTLEQWIALLEAGGPATEKERAMWLKAQHGLGTNVSGWVAAQSLGRGRPEAYDPDALVADMYAGKKAHLLPLYEAALAVCMGIGDDVKACPCSTIVPLYRNNVFAQIKPTTNNRLDVGLALKTLPVAGRLLPTGGLQRGDRITHRVPIMAGEELDDELVQLLRNAYELDG